MFVLLKHGYGTFDAKREIGPANWPHHDLLFVHRGTVELDFLGLRRRIRVQPTCGVLIWPRTKFRGKALGRNALVSIQHFMPLVGAPVPFARMAGHHNGFSTQTRSAGAWLDRCVRQAQELARDTKAALDTQDRRWILLALILVEGGFLANSTQTAEAKRIDAAKLEQWLVANLASNPGIPEMAAWAGLSPSRFRSVFLDDHGQSAGRFLIGLRNREAKRLLTETTQPLKEVAGALGYADQVVFHRAFKAKAGTTPANYRRECRAIA